MVLAAVRLRRGGRNNSITMVTFEHERLERLSGRLGVTAGELTARCRRWDLLEKRQAVMWHLVERDGWGCGRVGDVMGYSRPNVLHAVRKVRGLLSVGDRLMTELVGRVGNEG